MRVATYNVEWFANLFDAYDHLAADDGWSGRYNVTRAQQIEALGIVFTALNADAVMVIEAPDTVRGNKSARALEHFAAHFSLRTRKAVSGFANSTQQEITLLFDPDVIEAVHDPQGVETGKKGSADAPRFDGVFRIDLDIDATEDLVQFSKPPLELALKTVSGTQLRMIGAHLKSKAPHGARNRDDVMRRSIANRRKQLAQAIWLRARIDWHEAQGHHLIVLGDLNDGPGLDEYEHLFGRSTVEIILGNSLFDPHAKQTLSRPFGAALSTARFARRESGKYLQALLDYIMISSDLRRRDPQWRIWHPFDDSQCWDMVELREALLMASDHFPVTLDIDI